ncbi:hypothetical protein D910_05218, partial [Dendroctonus ponderosae]
GNANILRHPGYIHDDQNHPVPNAKLYVREANLTAHADSNGKYGIPLPLGSYTVIVEASRYVMDVKLVLVNEVDVPKVVIFMLRRNTTFWGVPRLAFVTLTGFILAGLLGLGIFCFVVCRKKTHDYGLLSQEGYLEDLKDQEENDESKETEVFSRPIKQKLITRPYFDEDEDDEENDFADIENTYLSSSEEDDEIKALTTRI